MPSTASPGVSPPFTRRLIAIDALRGLVMLLMLVDHVRETFYLHMQVSDPMDVATTAAGLFITRSLAHLCAPVFVFLTGLSAALYYQKTNSRRQTAGFLLTRGLFLMLLEVTLVNFAWTFQFPPQVIYLQVIWAIGLSMVVMSALLFVPRPVLLLLALVMIGGHNLLDGIHAPAGSFWSVPWAILHDRGWIEISDNLRIRTSYPLIPWPGIMALGFCAGPWFSQSVNPQVRITRLVRSGLALLAVFLVVRILNGYGEAPWHSGANAGETVMSFFNITKYPPSLAFCSLTLGIGLLLLALFERFRQDPGLISLACFGAAPMFFYLLHLYVLKVLYLGAVMIWGNNQGDVYGVDHLGRVWMMTVILTLLLLKPVQTFANFKSRRRDIRWLKYF